MNEKSVEIKREDDNLLMGIDKEFWPKWRSKLLFTLISVKVWGLAAATTVSTCLALVRIISGTQWVTFNTTIWALIFGMKEVFRIAEGREKAEKRLDAQQAEAEEKLARQKAEAEEKITKLKIQNGMKTPFITPAGLEIVGVNPD